METGELKELDLQAITRRFVSAITQVIVLTESNVSLNSYCLTAWHPCGKKLIRENSRLLVYSVGKCRETESNDRCLRVDVLVGKTKSLPLKI